jgi:hypothetical protein
MEHAFRWGRQIINKSAIYGISGILCALEKDQMLEAASAIDIVEVCYFM